MIININLHSPEKLLLFNSNGLIFTLDAIIVINNHNYDVAFGSNMTPCIKIIK